MFKRKTYSGRTTSQLLAKKYNGRTTSDLIGLYNQRLGQQEEHKRAEQKKQNQIDQAAYRARKAREADSMLELKKIKTIIATQGTTYQAVPNVHFNYNKVELW
jgi:hypothetical protein